jgi:hypothetical protein
MVEHTALPLAACLKMTADLFQNDTWLRLEKCTHRALALASAYAHPLFGLSRSN